MEGAWKGDMPIAGGGALGKMTQEETFVKGAVRCAPPIEKSFIKGGSLQACANKGEGIRMPDIGEKEIDIGIMNA